MDWMKIGSVVLLVMILFMLYPKVKHELKNGKKGSQKEWIGGIALLGGVAVFVWLLAKSM